MRSLNVGRNPVPRTLALALLLGASAFCGCSPFSPPADDTLFPPILGADAGSVAPGADASSADAAGLDADALAPGLDSSVSARDAALDSALPAPDATLDSAVTARDAALDGAPSSSDAALDGAQSTSDATLDGAQSAPDATLDASVPLDADAAAVVVDSGASETGTSDAAGTDAGSDGGAGGLSPLSAPLPTGKAYGAWTYVEVAGAKCRDGSAAGYYWRRGSEAPLMIFMNGGGACSDPFFCSLNPKNVNEDLPTQSLIDATGNLLLGPDQNRQLPPDEGVFKRDPRNPVANWNMIYVPYCTGDIFAGSKPDGSVAGVDGKQQFVGYTNVGLFLDSFGPSFAQAGKVLLTGSSAGGFGTLMNYDRTQTFFNKYNARVFGVTDSGVPMRDAYMAPCLQKRWRDTWNLNAALPKACTGCFRADGGGLAEGLGTYLFKEKYADRKLGGMISSVEDGVIRAFYGAGLENCTTDPGTNTVLSALNLGGYSGGMFRAGLTDIVGFIGSERIATYFLPSWEHMHLWRARYYEAVGGVTIAKWLGDVLADNPTHVGSP